MQLSCSHNNTKASTETSMANTDRQVYQANAELQYCQTINMKTSTHGLVCAPVQSCSDQAGADMFVLFPRDAGIRLLHGSWTLKHLSLNNLNPPLPPNNCEMPLIFCKIMAVILRWKRSRVDLWGSDWFGASHYPCRWNRKWYIIHSTTLTDCIAILGDEESQLHHD